jgi:hypothetical protein
LVHELRDTLEDLEEVYDMRNVATYIGIELNPIDMKRKKNTIKQMDSNQPHITTHPPI